MTSLPAQHPLQRRRPGRLIVVNGVTWTWQAGRNSVVAYSEHGDKKTAPQHMVKGVEPGVMEKQIWKRTRDGGVLPADVARWLSASTTI